jgi:hypothetical protein
MSEGEEISAGASPDERALAAQNRVPDPPLTSSERWKLLKLELMDELNGRLWTVLTRSIAVFTVVAAALGFFGIQTYIQSIFRDKIELETKKFDELRQDISREQATLYAHEKTYIMLFEMYLRDEQTMSEFASKAIDEINQAAPLNSIGMADLKKFVINGINKMASRTMDVKEYKTFRQEIIEKLPSLENLPSVSPINGNLRGSLGNLVNIYPHVSALDKTLRWAIDELVVKESTDDVAKSVLFREYETSVYPKYREWLDEFDPGYSTMAASHWTTLVPNADLLFPSLNPWLKAQKNNVRSR